MMANDFYKDLEELEDLIEDAFHIPLFKGKVILDESRFFDIMDNIRQNLQFVLCTYRYEVCRGAAIIKSGKAEDLSFRQDFFAHNISGLFILIQLFRGICESCEVIKGDIIKSCEGNEMVHRQFPFAGFIH